MINQRSAAVHLRGSGYPISAFMFSQPLLVDKGGVGMVVRATEQHQLAVITAGRQELMQVLLSTFRFGEYDGLTRGPKLSHAGKA
ncbi:Uncharacterised protein [Chlamydia trachomatis]|nr:Uncharacterised protein [Chlamydia trachomatis]